MRKLPLRDPRLLIGILLVGGGGVLGGVLLGGDDSVSVAQVSSNVAAGESLEGKVTYVEIPRGSSGSSLQREDVDETAQVRRTLLSGEFVSESDLAADPEPNAVDVRLPLAQTPASSISIGDEVTLWRVNGATTPGSGPGAENMGVAILVAVGDPDGLSNQYTAEVRMDEEDVGDVLAALGAADSFVLVAHRYAGDGK